MNYCFHQSVLRSLPQVHFSAPSDVREMDELANLIVHFGENEAKDYYSRPERQSLGFGGIVTQDFQIRLNAHNTNFAPEKLRDHAPDQGN